MLTPPTTHQTPPAPLPKSTAIVGAGPAGLFASIVLARRGYTNITVFDRLPRPPTPDSSEWGNPLRSYNLGLGARGQIALTEAEVGFSGFGGRVFWGGGGGLID